MSYLKEENINLIERKRLIVHDSNHTLETMSSDEGFEPDEDESLLDKKYTYGKKRSKTYRFFCCFCHCTHSCFSMCWRKLATLCGFRELTQRTVQIGRPSSEKYPANIIKNQKYNVITFIPLVLFNQFKFFLNLYFLIMALSQFIPEVRIGYLYTYWGPLGFVLAVTLIREAIDDFRRFRRDKEVNGQKYQKLSPYIKHPTFVSSSDIKVSDLIYVEKDQRVPADMVLLRTTERQGACFIRTDHLDGETDWKLRLAVSTTQNLHDDKEVLDLEASITAEKPQKDIHKFEGKFTQHSGTGAEVSLGVENTLWANTVVASGKALGIVIYTGPETRSVMNNSQPRSKVGLLDMELNNLTKVLFAAVIGLSLIMMVLKGFEGPWYRYMFRYILLFSYIIPISLRVNLDMGKMFYSWSIQKDTQIPGTVVRSTTIPEELGRISYIFTDKTGTLTQNEMVFKKLHLGTVCFDSDSFKEVAHCMRTKLEPPTTPSGGGVANLGRKSLISQVHEAVQALALCHNVTPVFDFGPPSTSEELEMDNIGSIPHSYQASSPDEVALVSWTESVGLILVERELTRMRLKSALGEDLSFAILQLFPFTSESKRMGIIVKEEHTGEIIFYMKGADVAMASLVQYNDWLDEACGNMAREGLRTLVVAKKVLTEEQYQDFEMRYHQAKLSLIERTARMATVVESLTRDMKLLCVTGVEDTLQPDVPRTLELLRNAGIKVWMLTGDKLETAASIAKASHLVARAQPIHIFPSVNSRNEAHLELNALRRRNDTSALVIKGDSLETCLKFYPKEFLELACQCPAVVCCRCSPTQKADVVRLIQHYTKKKTCAIGDGGNDVSMIQMADAGVGIEGKEGKQASLAADFSITQFKYIATLLLVHGRYSYKRSASLSQFVIHRGLIITIMQVVFSSVFYYVSVALYQGFLMVGYATIYTMFPVFFLVLDKDVSKPNDLLTYPELYKNLSKGRSLSFKTFFIWVLISIYQGSIIMYGALLLFEEEFIHIVAISFSALILTELLMVALTVRTWHILMVASELFSLAIYLLSLFFFNSYFDKRFIFTTDFLWKVCLITAVSCFPLYIIKYLHIKMAPPNYLKLT